MHREVTVTTEPGAFGPIGLVALGGAALAIQNLLLSGMVARGLGPITALAMNSAVGIVLLLGLNMAIYGADAGMRLTQTWQWWFLLPGLLGTFVVTVLLFGYTKAGAAMPTVALIAGQVITACLLDIGGVSSRPIRFTALTWLGLAMFIGGTALFFVSQKR
jgi:transporter family-2 protein